MTVLVPPDNPKIVQGENHIDHMVTTEDREIELECISYGGKPAPEVCKLNPSQNRQTHTHTHKLNEKKKNKRKILYLFWVLEQIPLSLILFPFHLLLYWLLLFFFSHS